MAVHSTASAAELRDIRCLGGRDTARLVLDLSDRVSYRVRQLPQANGAPARVYVDLPETRAGRGFSPCTSNGPLSRMQVARTDQGLRLVLDLDGAATARAFPLLDPFRIVVDVAPSAPPLVRQPTAPVAASTRATPPPPQLTIVLDPGHGGTDPGARGLAGIQEKDVVLAIALRLRDQLQALPRIRVVLTRERDEYLSLEERTARANAERADLFVSIHANASPDASRSGIETYYLDNTDDHATLRLAAMENGLASVTGRRSGRRDVSLLLSSLIQDYKLAQSTTFAETVQRDVVGSVAGRWPDVADLGVKRGPFYVLVGAGMPCILVEVSFVTHPQEGARLAQPAYREALSDGLLRGIRRFIDQHLAASTL